MLGTTNIKHTVTLRRVRVIVVAVEKQYYIFSVCVCNLSYPAPNKHALYYIVICGLSYFSTSHKRYDFWEEKVIERQMCVLICSTNFV